MAHQATESRDNYRVFYPVSTRWSDNDVYGLLGNVAYYSLFDSIANRYLMQHGGLDASKSPAVGLVVNSDCTYKTPLAFPDQLEGGLRVEYVGNSSVQYGIAIFKQGSDQAAAFGHLVQVFVDRRTHSSVPIPDDLRKALEKLKE